MKEREITKQLRMCIENAFGCCLDEVGEDECEDGEMFFSDGDFHIVLHDGRLCKTTYTAEDFLMIRFRREEDPVDPYVVIYMKNGDRLYYYNFEWADYFKTAWMLNRVGQPSLNDDALIDFFEAQRNTEKQVRTSTVPQGIDVIEYEEAHQEQVKNLLVELQTYLASLDDRGVLVLKENYREDYFAYLMGEMEKHEGKMFLARGAEGVAGLVVCKIFQGGGEHEITTSCPKIGFISDLVVTEKERGRGIGTALLTAAEKYFAERECAYAQLEVFAPNTAARRLYEDFGFKTNCLYLSKRTEAV